MYTYTQTQTHTRAYAFSRYRDRKNHAGDPISILLKSQLF